MATEHWTHSAVTDAGESLLNEMMAGHKLNIVKAKVGAGKVSAEEMHAQTDLQDYKQDAAILSDITTDTGRILCVQISNATAEFSLSELGLYAKLDDAGDEVLLLLMQDDDPVSIPDTASPTFLLEIYAVLKITNTGRFEVTIDKAGIVSVEFLEARLDRVKTLQKELTVSAEWKTAEEQAVGEYSYKQEIEDEQITESMTPFLAVAPQYIQKTAGLCPTLETKAGKLIIRSRAVLEEFTGTLTLVPDGEISSIPFDSRTIYGSFRLRENSGLKLSDDGYLSVEPITEDEMPKE